MNIIERYVERMMAESTPDRPLWNIERIQAGKANGWNYIDGCMMIALLNLHRITGQARYYEFAEHFLDHYVMEDGSLLGFNEADYNLDSICEGRVLFDVYRLSGKEKYRRAISTLYGQLLRQPRTWEGSFWHKAIYPNQVWLDGLYMAQVFYTRYTTEMEDCRGYEDIRRQFATVRKRMFDPKTGLYRHGYDASKTAFWADKETGCSRNPWLRSLGWFSAALIDVTAEIAPGHEDFCAEMTAIARELAENLRPYIDPDTRMLWQVPDQIGRAGNYPETSGSAMVAYFYLKGARLGLLDAAYADVGADIFLAICRRYLSQTDGKLNLGGICLVAGLGPENNRRRDGSYEYYISEPIVENDAKGLAPFLMCYTELLMAGKADALETQFGEA
ncbi:MAG: glycoside hydrolase family 88 protein [Clostridiales bacterium]|nr:glycoside hydrolase family 88 protein [Clostridiales bacterium]